ncbi:MAG: hypothetical protein AAGN35_08140 [Bacteroidota bacterium]
MNLKFFIAGLLSEGDGTVGFATDPDSITQEDAGETLLLLQEFYTRDRADMPERVPDFHPEAALWGGIFVYRTVQFILLRNLEAALIASLLPRWGGEMTPAVVYGADLCLRHLTELHHLARGLAPGDPLVERLNLAAQNWPFSSVGLPLTGEANLLPILDHTSLRMAYVDRIIAARDRRRVRIPRINALVYAALGAYRDPAWSDFEPLEINEIS